MTQWTRCAAVVALAAVIHAAPAAAQAKPAAKAAAGGAASGDQIALGDSLFHSDGNCYACHGAKAEGAIGPNLTDAEWIHSKGSQTEIAAQITHGVTKEQSKSGIVMPPKGGGTLSDDQVKAVAAYVYSLSHKS